MKENDEIHKKSWDVLLEYYKQTVEDCRTIGNQEYKVLVAIVVAIGGILYALVRIRDNQQSLFLDKFTVFLLISLSIILFLSLWVLVFLNRHLPIMDNIVIKIEKLQRDILFKKMDEQFLFDWGEIPGKCNDKLIDFLRENYGINWIKKEKIEKNDNNATIKVSNKKNSLTIQLNYTNTSAILKVNNKSIDDFIVKKEYDGLKIYESELKYRFREIYPHLNAFEPSKKAFIKALIMLIIALFIILMFSFIILMF